MTGADQTSRWVRDAEDALATAREALAVGRARNACMNAQLAIEMSAKALISRFAEPHWTHRPSPQLQDLLARSDEDLEQFCGPGARDAIRRLADDVDESYLWHGWSTYGRQLDDGTYRAAVDVCTMDAGGDLLARAEHAVSLALRVIPTAP